MSPEVVEKYVVEEMKIVRNRIDAEIASMNQYEILVMGFIGAVYALIFQYRIADRTILLMLAALPIIVAIYGYFRYRVISRVIRKHGLYLKEIEATISVQEASFVGLATFWDSKPPRTHIGKIRSVFWFAII